MKRSWDSGAKRRSIVSRSRIGWSSRPAGNVPHLLGADGEDAGESLARVMLETQHREGEKGAAQQHQQQAIEEDQPRCDRTKDHVRLVGIEHIAQAAHGADQLRLMALVDLAAQMADIDIDDVGQALEGLVPDLFHDHAARQDSARMQEQIFQQGIFLGAEFDALAVALDLAGQTVDLQRPAP